MAVAGFVLWTGGRGSTRMLALPAVVSNAAGMMAVSVLPSQMVGGKINSI